MGGMVGSPWTIRRAGHAVPRWVIPRDQPLAAGQAPCGCSRTCPARELLAKVIGPCSPSLIKNLITEALEASNHLLSWRNCFSISLPADLEDNKAVLDLPRGGG